jgi:hypothetical protein
MKTAIVERFADPEVVRLLDRVRSLSDDDQEKEAYQLPLLFGRPGVVAALEIGTNQPRNTWTCALYARDGLIDRGTISTPILIEVLDHHPLSRVTMTAAYVLGEIAWKQAKHRDTRIVDVALRFLARTRAAGYEEMGPAVGLARELSRAMPLPEATPYARELIDAVQSQRLDVSGAWDALGVLYQNEGLPFLDELGERARSLDEDHPLHADIATFIREITGPLLGKRSEQ